MKKQKKKSKYTLKFKNKVTDLIKKYKNYFDLDYKIFIEFKEQQLRDLVMAANADPGYKRAYVDVYPSSMTEGDEDLEEATAHEVSHIVLHELTESATNPFKTKKEFDKIVENAAVKISRALVRTET